MTRENDFIQNHRINQIKKNKDERSYYRQPDGQTDYRIDAY